MATTEDIRQHLAKEEVSAAQRLLTDLIQETTKSKVASVRINLDQYSLNSVNGFALMDNKEEFFFKFHQEEGEDQTIDEYYNAKVLSDAGFSVQEPIYASTKPGKQILLYRRVHDRRLADVCADNEAGTTLLARQAMEAQREADRALLEIARRTLRWEAAGDGGQLAFFQLFYNRLTDVSAPRPHRLGGRPARFYFGREVRWPGLSAPFEEIASCHWQINGVRYPVSLKEGFIRSLELLDPERFFPGPVLVSHGDAHNANVWFHPAEAGEAASLSLFDPAFASDRIPALLAEVKATFHNIFAHPFWLYEPERCGSHFTAEARREGDLIVVETDYDLSSLRRSFRDAKARLYWRPLLQTLKERAWLPSNWEEILRHAFFSCPTLVMNLLPVEGSGHTPTSSLIGFSQAVRAVTRPAEGRSDIYTRFFEAAAPEASLKRGEKEGDGDHDGIT